MRSGRKGRSSSRILGKGNSGEEEEDDDDEGEEAERCEERRHDGREEEGLAGGWNCSSGSRKSIKLMSSRGEGIGRGMLNRKLELRIFADLTVKAR